MDKLVERLSDFDRRVHNIAGNEQLSADGQMRALAILVTLNVSLFGEAAAALRSHALKEDSDG